jgi:hypothetical protein
MRDWASFRIAQRILPKTTVTSQSVSDPWTPPRICSLQLSID